jgi:hypothetical protein
MPKVLNAKHGQPLNVQDCVYIGRPSKWGNPFIIGRDGTRSEVIQKYRCWVAEQPELDLLELKGKDLVCWCAPLACHGDVLLKLANNGDTEFESRVY